MTDAATADLQSLTADIVAAYVSNNKINRDELAALIGATYQALSSAGAPEVSEPEAPKPDKAAVRKSVTPDHLISFLDGRSYKSLKRHLSTQGLSPDEYRQQFGLPKDYPMVASNYSAQRSELARTLGLGRKRQDEAPASDPAPAKADAAASAEATPTKPARRGRSKAAET